MPIKNRRRTGDHTYDRIRPQERWNFTNNTTFQFLNNHIVKFSIINKLGVALMGRNPTGLPCSVDRRTDNVAGGLPGRCRLPTRPAAGSVTDDDDRRF